MKVHHIAGPGDTTANVTMRADATATETADVRCPRRRSGSGAVSAFVRMVNPLMVVLVKAVASLAQFWCIGRDQSAPGRAVRCTRGAWQTCLDREGFATRASVSWISRLDPHDPVEHAVGLLCAVAVPISRSLAVESIGWSERRREADL
jgi:hypothetical protein